MGFMNEERLTLYDGLMKTYIEDNTVAKEDGKGLSTEDYTTPEKTIVGKLGESEEGTLTFNGSEIKTNTDVIFDTLAEAQAAIDAGEIEEGASVFVKEGSGTTKITIDSVMSDTSENPVQNKVTKKYVDDTKNDIQNDLSQLSNPNLLINPDFKINQRGGKIVESGKNYYSDESCGTLVSTTTSAYTATKISNGNYSISIDSTTYYVKASDVVDGYCEHTKYTVDRWLLWNISGIDCVVVNNNGSISIKKNSDDIHEAVAYQRVDMPLSDILGKTFTSTVCIDNTIISATYTIAQISQFERIVDVPITVDSKVIAYLRSYVEPDYYNSFQGISIAITDTTSEHTIYWAKLELGSVATPFVPPDPATELLKCQRYYWEESFDMGYELVKGNDGVLRCTITFPSTMRIPPTFSFEQNNTGGYTIEIILSNNNVHLFTVSTIGISEPILTWVYALKADAEIY